MTPCQDCLNADRGYAIHCGRCGCCDLRPNWVLILILLVLLGGWVAAMISVWRYLNG